MRWFETTHEIEVLGLGGAAIWRFRHFPRSGGVAAQDAKLMQQLEHLRHVADGLLAERPAGKSDDETLAEAHERYRTSKTTTH